MVDFKKRLKKHKADKPLDPLSIYDSLDRASDKGPLRPVQNHILSKWHSGVRDQRDLIIKLHTGQGKTLIGLLMLQSRLNENKGPALYLCPNRFLVEQTCAQAKQFGVAVITAEGELPDEFLASKAILVTTVHKMFNGLTKFGLGSHSLQIGTFLMDDCHACIDTIKQACSILLPADKKPYEEVIRLFENDLRAQGAGTFADLRNGEFDAFLTIPYWSWIDHCDEVTDILSKHNKLTEIKFAWPLVRDVIAKCLCIVSGTSLEILPHFPPLQFFGSFFDATHRIFMSATVTDDSFLVRGLGLERATIENPLTFPDEKWCGEKMLVLPSLLDRSLTREKVVSGFAKPSKKARSYGVVGLSPSFKRGELWEEHGAIVASADSIVASVEALKSGDRKEALCIVNRYDGVDLPDDACRILVIDSKPLGTSLFDRYLEACRPESDVIAQRTARIIEQGLGRSVRGEKDYCAVVLAGADLVQAIRSSAVRKYYSVQTQTQLDIGLEIAEFAKEDIGDGVDPILALIGLVKKLLDRDEGWKEFYVERMNSVKPASPDRKMLDVFSRELEAEQNTESGRWDEAASVLQQMIDEGDFSKQERGWYLQEMARYLYRHSKAESKKRQVAAHTLNRFLLKPQEGVTVTKLEVVPLRRTEAIAAWIRRSPDFDDLMIRVDGVLTDLRFGGDSDRFECAIQHLGEALGYSAERPDKEWGEGPDDLWCLRDNEYVLIECKNRVDISRDTIAKGESGQMNNSCAWFRKNYGDATVRNVLIFPGKKIGRGAGFNEPVSVMRGQELKKLIRNVRRFFAEFRAVDLADLEPKAIQAWLNAHWLTTEHLTKQYSVAVAK
jgi:replicative superfamily II helicase